VQQALDLCQNATEHVLKAVMAAVQARKDIDPGAVILKVDQCAGHIWGPTATAQVSSFCSRLDGALGLFHTPLAHRST
jgi:hypothetical protein